MSQIPQIICLVVVAVASTVAPVADFAVFAMGLVAGCIITVAIRRNGSRGDAE